MNNNKKLLLVGLVLLMVNAFGMYINNTEESIESKKVTENIVILKYDSPENEVEINWKDTALKHLKISEGFRSKVYTGLGGSQLIGYGFTYPRLWNKDIITIEQADKLLEAKFDKYVRVANEDGLYGHKAYAIADFIYNVGITKYKKSTLRKLIINKSSDSLVCNELNKWVHAGGKPYRGLIKRRNWETKLYCNK